MRAELTVGASARARLLIVVACAALIAGVALGVPALVILALVVFTPLLIASGPDDPRWIDISCEVPRGPLIEGDQLAVTVTVILDTAVELLTATIRANPSLEVDDGFATATDSAGLTWVVTLTPTRWGQAGAPTLHLATASRRGMRAGVVEIALPVTAVALPRPAQVGPLTAALISRARAGNHASRAAGDGVEFAGIRPFVSGDAPRRIHGPVSSRRGSPFVTERAAESAIDVVLVIDTFTEAGAAGASTLDLSLRGAAGLARALLANTDRVGLAMLGGVLGWLAPSASIRQWYRIAETALHAGPHESYVTPNIDRIPPVALPPGALVVVLSPLLDPRTLTVLTDLRRRRFDVVVIDVLAAPAVPPHTVERLGHRIWLLRRLATHSQITALGCTLTHWDGRQPLSLPLSSSPLSGHGGGWSVARAAS